MVRRDIGKLLNLQEKVAPWKRLIAFFIYISLVNLIILQPLDNITKNLLPRVEDIGSVYSLISSSNLTALSIITLVSGVITVLYWSLLDYKIQQTPGGIVFNLRVKSLVNKRLKFSQSLVRNITKISLPLLVIDSVFILVNPNGQRLFERLSKTITR